ncbi:unnamed protein product [Lupinus luteus]|uniref:Uncharacterized protein n=1 Tax=Lupinus luteus TaxID=3873 RepID=A0AAV1WZT0_LUPLU
MKVLEVTNGTTLEKRGQILRVAYAKASWTLDQELLNRAVLQMLLLRLHHLLNRCSSLDLALANIDGTR